MFRPFPPMCLEGVRDGRGGAAPVNISPVRGGKRDRMQEVEKQTNRVEASVKRWREL